MRAPRPDWKPVAAVLLSSAVVASVFLMLGWMFQQSQDQRLASCRATLVALDAIAETAEAGIREVPRNVLNPDDPLTPLFEQQRRATLAENTRRRAVIVRTRAAARQLARSDFCQ